MNDTAKSLLPKRVSYGNKGTFGKVVLIAGNEETFGAAILAAKAIYKVGAGMVKIVSTKNNRDAIIMSVPEVMFVNREKLKDALEWADVIAIGPGIGLESEAKSMLSICINDSKKPLIIDADGITILSSNKYLLETLSKQIDREIAITPHLGEFSRLTHLSIPEIKEDMMTIIKDFVIYFHNTIVCKDVRTIIMKESAMTCINTTGNNGMATAGSGDVAC